MVDGVRLAADEVVELVLRRRVHEAIADPFRRSDHLALDLGLDLERRLGALVVVVAGVDVLGVAVAVKGEHVEG